MKIKTRKHTIIEILIFTVVSVIALLMFRVVSHKIEVELKGFEAFLYERIKNEVGIAAEYESLSPSILPRFSFKNIKLKDANTGLLVANFEYLSVNYSLIEIFKSNYGSVVKSLDIKNGGIYFDVKENDELLKKIIKAVKSDEKKSNSKQKITKSFKISDIQINLRNITLIYADDVWNSEFRIFSGSIYSENDNIFYGLNSKCQYSNKNLPSLKNGSFNLGIRGNVSSDFTFASAALTMDGVKFSDFGTEKLSFFVSYKDSIISASSFQKKYGFGIVASFNTKSATGNATLNFNDFSPSHLIAYSKMNQSHTDLLRSKLTGNASLYFNLSDKLNPSFDWATDLVVSAKNMGSSKFLLHNTKLAIKSNGSQDFVKISQLSFNSNELKLNGDLYHNFRNNKTLGYLNLGYLKLKSGSISTKVKISNLGKSFICDVNEVNIGNAYFNDGRVIAIPKRKQLDFSFVLSDNTGSYELDGAYTYANKSKTADKGFVELHGVLNGIDVLNLYKSVIDFSIAKENVNTSEKLKPFRITSEFYASSDLKNFSYNFVQFIFASVEKNGLNLLASFNGSNASFNISNIDLGYRNMQVSGKANVDIQNYKDIRFDFSFLVNSIIYAASGMYSDGTLEVYGDYGFALNIYKNKGLYEGSFQVSELPIPEIPILGAKGKTPPLVFSTESNFQWKAPNDWSYSLKKANFVYSGLGINTRGKPVELSFNASGNPQELNFYDILLGNERSFLEGDAHINRLFTDGDLKQSFIASLNLTNSEKTERVEFNSTVSFSEFNNVYLDTKCVIDNLHLKRFFLQQAETDRIDCNIDFIGGLDNFLCNVNLESLEFHIKNKPLIASGVFSLDDGNLVIPDAKFYWDSHSLTSFSLNFLPEVGEGHLTFDYAGTLGKNEVGGIVDLRALKEKNAAEENLSTTHKLKNFLDSFSLDLSVNDWYFGEEKGKNPILFSVFKFPDQISFYGGENDEVYGFYMDDGSLSLYVSENLPTHVSVIGSVKPEKIELDFNDVLIDVPPVISLLSIENFATITNGNINGNLSIRGTARDPEFFGELELDDVSFYSPDYAPEILYGTDIPIKFTGTSLKVPYTIFNSKKFGLWAECTSKFDAWIPEETIVKCGTVGNTFGRMKTKNLLFHTDGDTSCDVVMTIGRKTFDLKGDVFFDKGSFAIPFGDFDKFRERFKDSDVDFSMNLALRLGNKAEFRWPNMNMPMLRTLIPTKEPIVFKVDEDTGLFSITGLANMRGGELIYIKRNFYIKEGNIHFLENIDGVEPLITLRAEIRDQDLDGEQVKLILSIKDHPLIGSSDDWIGSITTYPPRSDMEVKQLLGQVIIGDTNKDTAIQDALTNATDMLSQLGFAKKGESIIRDFLHLDVFSLRTQVVQNVVFGNIFYKETQPNLKAGNYLDNTTLYIGKYLGSAIYADGLLDLSYYDPLKDKNLKQKKPVWGSVLFRPEIGLEMATPFFNLRWAISPTDPDTLFVADTSLTFSWKFSY